MKDHFKKLPLLATLALLLFISCSKDDSSANIIGGVVFRSQVVTINLPDTDLPENEYQATLGGIAVTLSKADDHKLLFGLPAASALGLKDLIIPTLGNLTIRYDVKDTVLSETAEATMEPFKTNLTTYSQSLDNSANSIAIQNSITSFNAVYANLTPAEKTEMAIIYKANAALINDILAGNFSRFENRSSPNQNVITLFVLHKLAVLGIAAGAVLFELGTHPGVKALGAVLAGVSTGFAVEHFGNIIINRCVALGAVFDGIMGVKNRNSNNSASASIAFQSDEAKIINFNTNNRTLVSSDTNKTQSELVSFFKYNTKYNQIISNINEQITWVNNNVIFAKFSLLPVEVMPTSSSEANTVVNQAVFSNIQLSISDPNLTLVSSSLQSDGKLNLKIRIIGTPATLPIESFLNYSYSDEFNTFSGKLPIKVDNSLSIGSPYKGGVIAYILQPSDPGYITGEVHGIIAATDDQSNSAQWSNAIQICSNLVMGGYDDWYLPSQNELSKLWFNRTAIGNFGINIYWSSTESPFSSNSATCMYFEDSNMVYALKDYAYHARAIRVF